MSELRESMKMRQAWLEAERLRVLACRQRDAARNDLAVARGTLRDVLDQLDHCALTKDDELYDEILDFLEPDRDE